MFQTASPPVAKSPADETNMDSIIARLNYCLQNLQSANDRVEAFHGRMNGLAQLAGQSPNATPQPSGAINVISATFDAIDRELSRQADLINGLGRIA